MAHQAKQNDAVRAVARMVYPDIEPPMPYAVAASLLGIGVPALKYHIRKGRIRRAMIPGSKYGRGVIAADVRNILNATTAEGGAQ